MSDSLQLGGLRHNCFDELKHVVLRDPGKRLCLFNNTGFTGSLNLGGEALVLGFWLGCPLPPVRSYMALEVPSSQPSDSLRRHSV